MFWPLVHLKKTKVVKTCVDYVLKQPLADANLLTPYVYLLFLYLIFID